MNQKLWEPTLNGDSAIEKLQGDLGFVEYSQLHSWSITNPNAFWSRAWDDTEISGTKGSKFFVPGSDFISSDFFVDARLNVAENLLLKGNDSDVAIVSLLEDGSRSEITWSDLRIKVAATAAVMRSEGVEVGDRVVAWVLMSQNQLSIV